MFARSAMKYAAIFLLCLFIPMLFFVFMSVQHSSPRASKSSPPYLHEADKSLPRKTYQQVEKNHLRLVTKRVRKIRRIFLDKERTLEKLYPQEYFEIVGSLHELLDRIERNAITKHKARKQIKRYIKLFEQYRELATLVQQLEKLLQLLK